ncbi:uncharacterized protein A1O9_08624 [Exophiala aquamarina CBS 119918]|uniref:Uncharacterized protein n=1 Tax=Exophiala aquamarina CBS 119918 TaxID=1182545 RepID=A0A072P5H0_9EURO|nr:uncharacterized protein A1O9_08624 [Exophiala aquamarina CBS 119918]KEF54972.1 hypothetical protein A1O9_08624 [Exophiala aquamarina CBS 119918]
MPRRPLALDVPFVASFVDSMMTLILHCRRENGNKWTPVNSKIDDIRRGYQKVSSSTNGNALLMVKSYNASAGSVRQPHLNKIRQHVLRVVEVAVGSQDPARRRANISDFIFPLSSDHLIPLIHYNVWRAIVTNMILLGSAQMLLGCQSGDTDDSLLRVVPLPMPRAIPPSLQPTLLQQEINHESWIDLFPLPALRDTLIRAVGTYNECDLCGDMVGAIVEKGGAEDAQRDGISSSPSSGASRNTSITRPRGAPNPPSSAVLPDENKGLIIWGNPECIGSWEVSEGFARKWGWMIKEGCGELLRATDSHRQARSDDPIEWESFGIKCN